MTILEQIANLSEAAANILKGMLSKATFQPDFLFCALIFQALQLFLFIKTKH